MARKYDALKQYLINSNEAVFEKLREELSECGTIYPPMKLMDMCFWQAAFVAEMKEKNF